MFPGFNRAKRSTISKGDWDRDGVSNRADCEPLNFRKQDFVVKHIDEDEEEGKENMKRKFKTKKAAMNEIMDSSGYYIEEL